MNIIMKNKKIKGYCKNGKTEGWSNPPKFKLDVTRSCMYRLQFVLDETADTSNTYKYHYVTATDSVRQFKLYTANEWFTPLDSLPEYKIKVYSYQESEAVNLKLVYDGDYLFHLEGTMEEYTFYGGKTQFGCPGWVVIEDLSGNIFLTDSEGSSAISGTLTRTSGAGGVDPGAGNLSKTTSSSIEKYGEGTQTIIIPQLLGGVYSVSSILPYRGIAGLVKDLGIGVTTESVVATFL